MDALQIITLVLGFALLLSGATLRLRVLLQGDSQSREVNALQQVKYIAERPEIFRRVTRIAGTRQLLQALFIVLFIAGWAVHFLNPLLIVTLTDTASTAIMWIFEGIAAALSIADVLLRDRLVVLEAPALPGEYHAKITANRKKYLISEGLYLAGLLATTLWLQLIVPSAQ